MSGRSIRKWMLLVVALVLMGLLALVLSPPETETWIPYGGRGRVSQLLLELTGGPIQRHILHGEGATYRTDDEDFLTSTEAQKSRQDADARGG